MLIEGNDSDGRIITADHWWGSNGGRILAYRNRLVGNGSQGHSGDGGPALEHRLNVQDRGRFPHPALDLPPGVAPPRVHDLRHAFAVATLVRWYRSGLDPAQRLIHLSTFLGHVNPTSTAVYLTITDELLREASQRFERFAAPLLASGDEP